MAENIGWQLEKAGYSVKLADIGKVQESGFTKGIVTVHQYINNHLPFVWSFLYKWGHYVILPFRIFIAGFNSKETKILIEQFQPDLVISVQTSASAVVAYLKKKGIYKNLFGIGFSDFHLHRYWLYNEADFYLANIEEQKTEMVKMGIPENKIFVCGMTLKDKPVVDTEKVKMDLNIKPGQKVVLAAAGSLGIGLNREMLIKLSRNENLKILIVCGKNVYWYNLLSETFKNKDNVSVLGFYKPMDDLYAVADVFVSKPGGLSTTESLQWNLPLIVSSMLPGQEELNYTYLTERKIVIPIPENMVEAVENEALTGRFKNSLLRNPFALCIPQGGKVVKAISSVLNEK